MPFTITEIKKMLRKRKRKARAAPKIVKNYVTKTIEVIEYPADGSTIIHYFEKSNMRWKYLESKTNSHTLDDNSDSIS